MDELYFGRPDEDLYLMHVGRSKEDGAPGRGSGRYPLGSGETPNQHVPHKAWSYEETQKLLYISGKPTLYARIRYDAVIIYALERHMDPYKLHELMEEVGEKPLFWANE